MTDYDPHHPGFKKIVDKDPTAPLRKLVFAHVTMPEFSLAGGWRKRAHDIINYGIRFMDWLTLDLNPRLMWVRDRLWEFGRWVDPPKGILHLDLPISKIIEDNSVKDICTIEDRARNNVRLGLQPDNNLLLVTPWNMPVPGTQAFRDESLKRVCRCLDATYNGQNDIWAIRKMVEAVLEEAHRCGLWTPGIWYVRPANSPPPSWDVYFEVGVAPNSLTIHHLEPRRSDEICDRIP